MAEIGVDQFSLELALADAGGTWRGIELPIMTSSTGIDYRTDDDDWPVVAVLGEILVDVFVGEDLWEDI